MVLEALKDVGVGCTIYQWVDFPLQFDLYFVLDRRKISTKKLLGMSAAGLRRDVECL